MRFQIRDNDIYANTGVGFSIGDDGAPVVEANRVYGGHTAGIYVSGANAKGSILKNEIYENQANTPSHPASLRKHASFCTPHQHSPVSN